MRTGVHKGRVTGLGRTSLYSDLAWRGQLRRVTEDTARVLFGPLITHGTGGTDVGDERRDVGGERPT